MLINILVLILLCLCLIEYNKCENFSKFSSNFNNEQNNKYSNNVVTFTTPSQLTNYTISTHKMNSCTNGNCTSNFSNTTPTTSHISSNSSSSKSIQNISNISNTHTHTERNNNNTDNTNSCSDKLSKNTRISVLVGTIFFCCVAAILIKNSGR